MKFEYLAPRVQAESYDYFYTRSTISPRAKARPQYDDVWKTNTFFMTQDQLTEHFDKIFKR